MTELLRIFSSALVSGSVASIVSAGALAVLAKSEGNAAARPLNATSHWWHGDGAGSVQEVDLAHTGVGYATHHASSVLWALMFEALRARDTRTDLASIARDAATVSAAATVIDYGVMPRRLTPGWELALPQRSVAVGLAALAAGLTLGGLITRHMGKRMSGRTPRPTEENDATATRSEVLRQGAR
jgi:hypothetical protein